MMQSFCAKGEPEMSPEGILVGYESCSKLTLGRRSLEGARSLPSFEEIEAILRSVSCAVPGHPHY